MAKKVLKYYEGKSIGDNLTEDSCKILDKIRHLNNENGAISDLKHCIYSLSPSDIEQVKRDKSNDNVDLKLGTLEDLQTLGVAYMYYAKKMILGDSVGMGKTVEVCGLLNLLRTEYNKRGYEFRFLYLTEKTLVNETRDKLIQFTGDYVEDVYGDKSKVLKFLNNNRTDLQYSVVGPHSLIKSIHFQNYISENWEMGGCIPFDILIIDESSILGNRNSQMSQAAKWLADKFDYVIILNATVFEDNLSIFYNQLYAIDESILPTLTEFNKKFVVFDYTGPYPVPSGKYKNADEFKRLICYRYFSRTRKSTGAFMKDCTADVLISDLSKLQKELLPRVSIPNMVYDCPAYFYDKDFETTFENTPKLYDMFRIVDKLTDINEPVLIYAQYKEAQDIIQEMLIMHGIYCEIMNGDTKVKEKNRLIKEFKLGAIPVLITNVQKGLDFGKCNHCIFYNSDPNPNKMVQFEGRMTRDYNIVGKHIYILVSRGKELDRLKKVIADRAIASDMFAGSDFSCVMNLLLDGDKVKNLK